MNDKKQKSFFLKYLECDFLVLPIIRETGMSDESTSSRESCPICGEVSCVCEKPLPKMGVPPKRLLPQSGKGRGRGRGKEVKQDLPTTSMENVTEVEDNFEKDYIPYSPLQRLIRAASSGTVEQGASKSDDSRQKGKKGKGKEKQVTQDEDESYSAYSPLQRLHIKETEEEAEERKSADAKADARRRAIHISAGHEPELEDLEEFRKSYQRHDDDSDHDN